MIRTAACLASTVAILLLGCNPSGPSHVVTVTIVPTTDALKVAETVHFSLSVVMSPGAPQPIVAPSWSSDNPDTASVDLGGTVVGKSPGRARLVGCIGDHCDSRMLTVTPPG
jgi:uncharacterized protein YjdB